MDTKTPTKMQKIDPDELHEIWTLGFTEGQKHTKPSALTIEKIGNLDKDLKTLSKDLNVLSVGVSKFKSAIIYFLLSLLASFIFIGIWVGNIQSRADNNKEDIYEVKTFLTRIEEKIDNLQ